MKQRPERQRLMILRISIALSPILLAAAVAGGQVGVVYTATNEPGGNRVAIIPRAADGTLGEARFVPTDGLGTGAGLGNQGAMALSGNGRFLYVVNAGSDSISVLDLNGGAAATQTIASGGDRPVSLTMARGLLYVLNAGGQAGSKDTIVGFRVKNDGALEHLPHSSRPLSGPITAPAQVGFDQTGTVLAVTEKMTNLITTYTVGRDGMASAPVPQASSGATPFGFEFNRRNVLIVSEAFGGVADASAVSSYTLAPGGLLQPVSITIPTNETAACWIVSTSNGRFTYTTNTGSGTVTGYAVDPATGALAILDEDGLTGVTGPDTGPIDADTVGNRFLYVLSRPVGRVDAFRIGADGSLTPIDGAAGLPLTANGLVAR